MDIAVVGSTASTLCKITNVGAKAFRALSELPPGGWDILALTQMRAAAAGSLYAHSLLLPGSSDPALAKRIYALQIISYGLSPRDTLTLSSFSGSERMICLQRSLLTVHGGLLEPQELPLPPALSGLCEESALLAAGVCLLSLGKAG